MLISAVFKMQKISFSRWLCSYLQWKFIAFSRYRSKFTQVSLFRLYMLIAAIKGDRSPERSEIPLHDNAVIDNLGKSEIEHEQWDHRWIYCQYRDTHRYWSLKVTGSELSDQHRIVVRCLWSFYRQCYCQPYRHHYSIVNHNGDWKKYVVKENVEMKIFKNSQCGSPFRSVCTSATQIYHPKWLIPSFYRAIYPRRVMGEGNESKS